MTTAEFIATFLGGGLVQFGIQLLLNMGRSKLNRKNLSINYTTFQMNNTISYLVLDLQFINTSGHKVIVENINARFFDGENFIEYKFEEHNLPPACVICRS